MRRILSQTLGRPKVSYLAISMASLVAVLIAIIDFLDLGESIIVIRLMLLVFMIGLIWLAAISHIVGTRRASNRLLDNVRKQVAKMQRENRQLLSRIAGDIKSANEKNHREYEKHTYDVLISNQQLRLAVLDQKGKLQDNE